MLMSLFLLMSPLVIATITGSCSAFQKPPHHHRSWPPISGSTNKSTTHRMSSTTNENITTKDVLSLSSIRSTLIRQEETIIFALIERAQFRRNDVVYQVGGVEGLGCPVGAVCDDGNEFSFLDWMFIGTVRRYTIHVCFCNERLSRDVLHDQLNFIRCVCTKGSTSLGRSTIRINRRTRLLPGTHTQTHQLPLYTRLS